MVARYPRFDLRLPQEGKKMRNKAWMILAALAVAVSGCAPLLIGSGAAVVADEAIEQDRGGDGLF